MRNRRIWGLVVRHLFSWPRDLEAIAESFWWPSFDVFIWGLTTVYLQSKQGVPEYFISLFLGAIVLWMFVYRSQQEMGFMFLREFWDRNLLNILTTPLTIGEFLLSSIMLGSIKLAISAIWMVIIAYVLFTFNLFSLGWYLIPFVINLLLVGWSGGFFINGLIMRYGYRIQAFAWTLILFIQPFSAVFYPVSVMPGWMQLVAKILPTSYVFEGMRAILTQGKFNWQLLVVASSLNCIYLALSLYFFKYSFSKAQEIGMIVKFS